MTKQTIKDILGVMFFKLLPTKETFQKDLKKRIRELKGKFTKKPKTSKSSTGKVLRIVMPFFMISVKTILEKQDNFLFIFQKHFHHSQNHTKVKFSKESSLFMF